MTQKDTLDFALKLITVAIAVFGIWKYFDTEDRATVREARSQSIALIERYSSRTTIAARQSLIDFWLSHPEFTEFARTQGGVSTRELRGFVHATMKEQVSHAEFRAALFELSNFYDGLWACRGAQICDAPLIDQMLCQQAKTHAVYYSVFFEEFNGLIGGGNFGKKLNEYASACTPPP